jgi:hypothetical protein
VNDIAAEEVARNLLVYPGRPFLEWLRTDAAGNLILVVPAGLPLRHAAPYHGSLADTANMGGLIDSIRAVRVNLYATNGLTGSREVLRALVTTIRIPNAGLTKQRSCGDTPIFGRTVSSSLTGPSGSRSTRIRWDAAVDEFSGETDIERYLIYRRTLLGSFDDALATIPAGQATYQYDDGAVLVDSTYVYAVTALDCTPLESSSSSSSPVFIAP